jgi:hypothetical protein
MITNLIAVTIRTWSRSHTWFLDLPMVNGRAHLPEEQLSRLLNEWGLPRGTTISIG